MCRATSITPGPAEAVLRGHGCRIEKKHIFLNSSQNDFFFLESAAELKLSVDAGRTWWLRCLLAPQILYLTLYSIFSHPCSHVRSWTMMKTVSEWNLRFHPPENRFSQSRSHYEQWGRTWTHNFPAKVTSVFTWRISVFVFVSLVFSLVWDLATFESKHDDRLCFLSVKLLLNNT